MIEDDIEAHIMAYVNQTLAFGDYPNRNEAIRRVTGELPVMPSAVAKVLKRLVEERKLIQRADESLRLTP